MNCSLLKAAPVAAVVAVVAATAAGTSSAPLPAALLSSQPVLWIAANVIVVWLVSSYRNHTNAAAAVGASAGHGEEVNALMHASLYPSVSTGHAAFDGAAVGTETGVEAPVAKRKKTREARAARRSGERLRERKVAAAAGEEKPRAFPAESTKPVEEWASTVVAAAEAKLADGEEERPSAAVVAAADAKTDGSDDDSMDSMWQSILQRGAARPVAARKSDTWAAAERPRLERLAETAVARREMRKSATAINMSPPASPHHAAATPPAAPANTQGWRTRDVLVTTNDDELLRRAESLIRRHHEHLRLQRKESEQRQALERQTRRPAPQPPSLIRV